MIVKKMPILQWFPDFDTVKNLSFSDPLFYDIETTGLSRNSTFCYLIGAVIFEKNRWILYQWLAERKQEEPVILKEFSRFLSAHPYLIQYNGTQFDQPYLEERFKLHNLSSPFSRSESLDLYKTLKPLKELLKLPGMKQPQLEEFMDLPKRCFPDGHQCIRLFRNYSRSPRPDSAEELLGHNREDLERLGRILLMTSYLDLLQGNYHISQAEYDGEHLLMTLTLPNRLPAPFSNGTSSFYITGEDHQVRLAIKSSNGHLRQYYPNYKDYHYIPSEDTAMPKSLSACLAPSLRKPARPETCYTWFDCRSSFLKNEKQQHSYLKNTLPFLIHTL